MIATPIGTVRVEGDEAVIASISIVEGKPVRGNAAAVRTAAEQIEQWFAGERHRFDLVLTPSATLRGAALRQGLIDVRYGETLSYGALARLLGSSARAVGQLCARNSFPIVVPCHRVVGADGALGHYSAGAGPSTKFWLLEHERRQSGETLL